MLVIEVGQCGIQVGAALEAALVPAKAAGAVEDAVAAFVDAQFGAVLVDTEHKTWSQRAPAGRLRARSVVDCGRVGRGNVWTFGYGTDATRVLAAVRRLVERGGAARGFLVVHSVAGGTGSGLGARIAQLLREHYPEKPLVCASVLPFASGDAPLQSYNTLLALAQCHEACDAVLLFPNDELYAAAQRDSGASDRRAAAVDLQALNAIAGRALAGVLFPTTPVSDPPPIRRGAVSQIALQARPVQLWDLIESVTPLPSHKIVKVASAHADGAPPLGGNTWNALIGALTAGLQPLHYALRAAAQTRESVLVAGKMFLRGVQPDAEPLSHARGFAGASASNLCTALERINAQSPLGFKRLSRFSPLPLDYTLSGAASTTSAYPAYSDASASLLYNSNLVIPMLKAHFDRAGLLYAQRAYVHWYERYWASGLCDYGYPDVGHLFEQSFECLRRIQGSYLDL